MTEEDLVDALNTLNDPMVSNAGFGMAPMKDEGWPEMMDISSVAYNIVEYSKTLFSAMNSNKPDPSIGHFYHYDDRYATDEELEEEIENIKAMMVEHAKMFLRDRREDGFRSVYWRRLPSIYRDRLSSVGGNNKLVLYFRASFGY